MDNPISIVTILILGISMIHAVPIQHHSVSSVSNNSNSSLLSEIPNAFSFRTASITPAVKKDLSSISITKAEADPDHYADNVHVLVNTANQPQRQVTIQSASGFPIISITKPSTSNSTNRFPNVLITSGAPVITDTRPTVLGVLHDIVQRVTNIALPGLSPGPVAPKPKINLPPVSSVTPPKSNPNTKASKEITIIPQITVPAFTIPALSLALNVKPVDQKLAAQQAAMFHQFEKEINGNNNKTFDFPYEIFNTSSYTIPEVASFSDVPHVLQEQMQSTLFNMLEIMAAFIHQAQLSGLQLTEANNNSNSSNNNGSTDDIPLIQRFPDNPKENTKEKPFHTVVPILESSPESNGKSDPTSIGQKGTSTKPVSSKLVENSVNSKHKPLSVKPAKLRPVYGYQAAEYKPKKPSVNEQMNEVVAQLYRILMDSYGIKRKEFKGIDHLKPKVVT